MHRIVTRLRTLFVHAPLGFIATHEGAFAPGTLALHEGSTHRRRAPVMPLRLANGVMAYRHEPDPEPPVDQPHPEIELWCWQGAEGLDKPLAYSR